MCVCVCVVRQCAGFQQRVCELEAAERQSRESLKEKEADLQAAKGLCREADQQLERAAEEAEAQTGELKLDLDRAEDRARDLHDKLGLAEAAQHDTDLKLRDLWNTVYWGLGLGGRAGLSRSQGARRRPSPGRSYPAPQRRDALRLDFAICRV